MTDANDAFTVGERYRPTAINNVRSKSITAVVYINSRCASTVPSALAELLVPFLLHTSVVNEINRIKFGTRLNIAIRWSSGTQHYVFHKIQDDGGQHLGLGFFSLFLSLMRAFLSNLVRR